MKKAAVDISQAPLLVLADRPPEMGGGEGQRRNYALLTALSRLRRVHCLADRPPLSVKMYKEALSRRGVDFIDDRTPENRDFFPLIQRAVSSQNYAAIIVACGELCERYLTRLRLQQPEQIIIWYLPLAGDWLNPLQGLSPCRESSVARDCPSY